MPGALIEPLFITDPYEGTLAASPSGQEVIAGGLAKAIEQYFAPAALAGRSTDAARPTHRTSRQRGQAGHARGQLSGSGAGARDLGLLEDRGAHAGGPPGAST